MSARSSSEYRRSSLTSPTPKEPFLSKRTPTRGRCRRRPQPAMAEDLEPWNMGFRLVRCDDSRRRPGRCVKRPCVITSLTTSSGGTYSHGAPGVPREQARRMARRGSRAVGLVLLTALCCSCGGGGSSPPPAQTPASVAPAPAPPATPQPPTPVSQPNRAPIVANPITPFPRGIGGHVFSFDFTQGGTTFADP